MSATMQPAATDAQLREYVINLPGLGFPVRVLEAGQGPLVLLLHGNPDNAEEWVPAMRELSRDYRCVAPDLPGYGKSPEPPAGFDYSKAAQIAFVDALLAALKVSERFTMVVHDVGGVMGIAWAGANSGRLRALLITNTVAFEGFEWFAIAKTWGNDTWLGRLRARAGISAIGWWQGRLFKKIFWKQSPQLTEEQIDRVVSSFAVNPAAKNSTLRQFRWMTRPDFFDDFDRMLKDITAKVPTAVLWGDGDPYVPTRFASRFGSARVTVLPNAGHWVALVEPRRLAQEVNALTRAAVVS
jgi:pimeloyl-ACP methyl ester carboxylesterase